MTFYDAIQILRRKALRIFAVSFCLGLLTLGVSYMLTPWYAVSALLKPAQIPNIDDDVASQTKAAGKLSSIAALAGSLSNASQSLEETESFLKFRYITPTHEPDAPYLKSVKVDKLAGLIELTAYGHSPEEAQAHLRVVLTDLQKWVEPRIDSIKGNAKSNIALLDEEISTLKDALKTNELALQRLGFSAMLVQGKMDLEAQYFRARSERGVLAETIDPTRLSNYSYIDVRSMTKRHAYPRKGQAAAAVTIFSGFLLSLFYVLQADFENRKRALNHARELDGAKHSEKLRLRSHG